MMVARLRRIPYAIDMGKNSLKIIAATCTLICTAPGAGSAQEVVKELECRSMGTFNVLDGAMFMARAPACGTCSTKTADWFAFWIRSHAVRRIGAWKSLKTRCSCNATKNSRVSSKPFLAGLTGVRGHSSCLPSEVQRFLAVGEAALPRMESFDLPVGGGAGGASAHQ